MLIDTNIFVYALDKSSEFHDVSQQILFRSGTPLYTTSKNLSELLVVLTREGHRYQVILDVLSKITTHCTILYPDAKSSELLLTLASKYNVRGKRIHDIEITAIALTNGLNVIATFNVSDFKSIKEIRIYQQ